MADRRDHAKPAGCLRVSLELTDITAETAATLLRAAVTALDANPPLAEALRRSLFGAGSALTPAGPNMTVKEYASHARVSERTIREQVKMMTESEHYHRDGASGRRIILHTEAADRWRAERRPRSTTIQGDPVADEVTRRRAAIALRKARRS